MYETPRSRSRTGAQPSGGTSTQVTQLRRPCGLKSEITLHSTTTQTESSFHPHLFATRVCQCVRVQSPVRLGLDPRACARQLASACDSASVPPVRCRRAAQPAPSLPARPPTLAVSLRRAPVGPWAVATGCPALAAPAAAGRARRGVGVGWLGCCILYRTCNSDEIGRASCRERV